MTVIDLPFPPSTNNLFINVKKGRIPSQRYEEWRLEAGYKLNSCGAVSGPVSIAYEFGEPDKRKRDLDNLLKAPSDLLVTHGIIEADDNSIVRSINATWNSSVTGVRITITPIGEKP